MLQVPQAEALKLVFKEIDTQDVDEVTFEAEPTRILEKNAPRIWIKIYKGMP